jgi:hypothetical protein
MIKTKLGRPFRDGEGKPNNLKRDNWPQKKDATQNDAYRFSGAAKRFGL